MINLLNKVLYEFYVQPTFDNLHNYGTESDKISHILENQEKVWDKVICYQPVELRSMNVKKLDEICADLDNELGVLIESDQHPAQKQLKAIKIQNGANAAASYPKVEGNKDFKPVKNNATPEQEAEIKMSRGAGMQDLQFDNEPDEKFMERMKKDMGDTLYNDRIKKAEAKKKQPMYNKEPQPVVVVKEEVDIVAEEMARMKNLYGYSSNNITNTKYNIKANQDDVFKKMIREDKFKSVSLSTIISENKILSRCPAGREVNSYDNKSLKEWTFADFKEYVTDYSSDNGIISESAPAILKAIFPTQEPVLIKDIKIGYQNLVNAIQK